MKFTSKMFSVVNRMFPSGHNLKVFNTVVKPIPVTMMDNFIFIEFSAYSLFHNMTMFFNRFIIHTDYFVSIFKSSTSIFLPSNKSWVSMSFPSFIVFNTVSFSATHISSIIKTFINRALISFIISSKNIIEFTKFQISSIMNFAIISFSALFCAINFRTCFHNP